MDDDAWSRYAEYLPEPMLLVAGDGVVLGANRAAGALLRRDPSHLAGLALSAIARDDPRHVDALLRIGSRTREPMLGTLQVGADGEAVAMRCDAMQLRPAAAGRPARVVLRLTVRRKSIERFLALNQRIEELGREIARRRTAESRLQDYSERLRVTLASIGDAVIATDADGVVVLMNRIAESLTGWSAADAQGRQLEDVFVIVDQATREPIESPVSRVLRDGAIGGVPGRIALISRDGSERLIDDSGAPIRAADGALVGIVLVFRDDTERRAMEIELQHKTERLVDASRRKDEFMSMLSHELRNPLAPLTTGVELLQRHALPAAEVGRIATMMERQLRHMTRLVDDLLDAARLTQGKIELRREPIRLAPILDQAAEMVRPLADARGQSLVVDADDAAGLVVDGDAMRLVQVFGNLLSNAVKFTGPGGHVRIAARRLDDRVQVDVVDDGAGIDAALLPQVFELFVQADRSLDRAQGGLGIGLTVVRSIVEMHGGTVSIDSPGSGHGTTVGVQLPLHFGTGASLPQSPGTQPASGPGNDAAVSGRPLRVLVVDDNRDAGEMLGELMQIWGHESVVVTDGDAALTESERWQPDAVLLDIGLPGLSGHEVARRLRRADGGARLLLAAITGYGSPGDQQASRDAGFDEHLTKPVDLDRLQAMLDRQARRLGLADEVAG